MEEVSDEEPRKKIPPGNAALTRKVKPLTKKQRKALALLEEQKEPLVEQADEEEEVVPKDDAPPASPPRTQREIDWYTPADDVLADGDFALNDLADMQIADSTEVAKRQREAIKEAEKKAIRDDPWRTMQGPVVPFFDQNADMLVGYPFEKARELLASLPLFPLLVCVWGKGQFSLARMNLAIQGAIAVLVEATGGPVRANAYPTFTKLNGNSVPWGILTCINDRLRQALLKKGRMANLAKG